MRIPRLRFTMRAVLVAMTALTLALFLVVTPVYRVLEERRGTCRLLAAGAALEDFIYLKRDYEPAAPKLRTRSTTAPEKMPRWVAILAGDAAKLRPDVDVLAVYAHDDDQVEALCDDGE